MSWPSAYTRHDELPRAYGHLCREHQDELHDSLCRIAIDFDCPISGLIIFAFPEPQEGP